MARLPDTTNQVNTVDLPYFPDDAPFSESQRKWLAGFFAGMNSRLLSSSDTNQETTDSATPLVTVLYGTQTGNAETLANETAERANEIGLNAEVYGMDEIEFPKLSETSKLLVITSTYGEGEMPDNAMSLWKAANEAEAPRMEKTEFAVLSLGDTSYDLFCQAGIDWERRLEELGACKVLDRVDCDLDFEEPFDRWLDEALPAMNSGQASVATTASPTKSPAAKTKPKWSKKKPFTARLLTNRILTTEDSSKETRHYEISLKGADMDYEAGDALGVLPTNCPELVSALIDTLGLDPEASVVVNEDLSVPLRDALINHFEIKLPSKELIATLAEESKDPELNNLLLPENKQQLSNFLWGKDSIDLIERYPAVRFTAEELLAVLKRLQPRLYSISSSPKQHEGEVHLTVASVRYESEGNTKKGVCSTFLADRVSSDTEVPCYIAANKNFRVPADPDAPMIMVGPGTGIAPFRAFLEERHATQASGKNWLFFGDRNRSSDFIYEDEITTFLKDGLLTRLDLAFSRDQEQKVYVQDRMREKGAELFSWLEDGGSFFVCGDAYRMAKDVDTALHDVISEHGSLTQDEAEKYVEELKKTKRYVRDVY